MLLVSQMPDTSDRLKETIGVSEERPPDVNGRSREKHAPRSEHLRAQCQSSVGESSKLNQG